MSAQEKTSAEHTLTQKPQVRVNYLNVCTPSDVEQQELATTLKRIPVKPVFVADDFEISRGRIPMPDAPASSWVRMRREFPAQSVFSNVQYMFSSDSKEMNETLVFRVRDGKDVLQVSIQDTVAATTTPDTFLGTNTPADRIKIERFGKASLALARCRDADQSKYEPLFRSASELLAVYRSAMAVRSIVAGDLSRMAAGNGARTKVGGSAVKK